jgi:fused signal recognition particle receptor
MFLFLKNQFKKLYTRFTQNTINQTTLQELQTLLLHADVGITTTNFIIEQLKLQHTPNHTVHETLQHILIELLTVTHAKPLQPIIIMVGINGSGKTTGIAHLTHFYQQQHKKILLAAADTFRAGAVEQLKIHAQKLNVPLIKPLTSTTSPSTVVFQASQEFNQHHYDLLLIDTAGRLQTKTTLMQELEKIGRVITKQSNTFSTILSIDSLLGQNSLEQARLFHAHIPLDGILLTKTDSTSKGGIIFAIAHELKLPIIFISFGETIGSIASFNPTTFVSELLALEKEQLIPHI